jgi:hypothetical protein
LASFSKEPTMREREVVRIVAERLKSEGARHLQVRYAREPGPDIEAVLPNSHRQLFIEAKGDVKSAESALGVALYQILCRYDGQAVCAIAVPFSSRYQDLLRKVLAGLGQLRVHVLLVREAEVWHLPPNAKGFLPTKPSSLVEALENEQRQ